MSDLEDVIEAATRKQHDSFLEDKDTCSICGGLKFWQVYQGKLRAFCPCEIVEALK